MSAGRSSSVALPFVSSAAPLHCWTSS